MCSITPIGIERSHGRDHGICCQTLERAKKVIKDKMACRPFTMFNSKPGKHCRDQGHIGHRTPRTRYLPMLRYRRTLWC